MLAYHGKPRPHRRQFQPAQTDACGSTWSCAGGTARNDYARDAVGSGDAAVLGQSPAARGASQQGCVMTIIYALLAALGVSLGLIGFVVTVAVWGPL